MKNNTLQKFSAVIYEYILKKDSFKICKAKFFSSFRDEAKVKKKKNMVVFDKTTGMQFSFYLITTMITRDEETISDPVLKKLRFKLTMKKKE